MVHSDADRRWLFIALTLIVVYMCGEVVAGVLAHSLALISDAAHMLADAASIVLALVAMRLAARPARGGYTPQDSYSYGEPQSTGRPPL